MWVRKYQIVPATVDEVIEVDRVFSGFPVAVAAQLGSFGLYTTATHQFIAYFDTHRRLCVASRVLGDRRWKRALLPEALGWDSHNYVTLAVDPAGHVHVSGNMHASPLCYYRSDEPGDIATLRRIHSLTGTNENEITYPRFLRDPAGLLLYTYRNGRSGAGDQVVKGYDHREQSWSELNNRPLIDGEGKRNAYLQGPCVGTDGFFHMCWVWRDTDDAASTHSLCYARSRDLRRWETSGGAGIDLPITFDRAEVIDPVGCNRGLINNNHLIGFDTRGRVVVSYQKHDEFGNTQIYQARGKNGGWAIHRSTDWPHRWEIGGPGSLVFELQFGAVETDAAGRLLQWYRHKRFGAGTLILDTETLETIGQADDRPSIPPSLEGSSVPGMQVNWSMGAGEASDTARYWLRWETLPENRDAPRRGPLPAPSALCLYRVTPGRTAARADAPHGSFYWNCIPDFPAPRERRHADQERRRSLEQPTWLDRIVGWASGLRANRPADDAAQASADVEREAEHQAESAFASGDWAAAASQWQRLLHALPQHGAGIGGIKLNLSVARRLARLEEYRRDIASYAASRTARDVRPEKVAIYTAISDNYDSVKLPELPDPRFDYLLFTDAPRSGGDVWRVRPMTAYDTDPVRMARYVKTHPHLLLGEYRYAIWIDSNLGILGDIHALLEMFVQSGKPVAAILHPYRTSIDEEVEACIAAGRDDTAVMREQVARYREVGFACQDLIESNLMMFDLANPCVPAFLDRWWSEIDRGSKRDQLSLNYALAKTGLDWYRITARPDSARNHPVLAFAEHDYNNGVARRLLDALGGTADDPYDGLPYEQVREQRIAAQNTRRIDVVICAHNALEYLTACLESVRRNRSSATQRIIIVDDGSDDSTAAFLKTFASSHAHVELIRNDQPVGYTRAANKGLAASNAELVILLNSDTIVTDGWAEKMADAVYSTPGTGIVGPMSNAASFQSIPDHRATEQQTAINPLPPGMSADDVNRCCERWTVDGVLPRVPLVHGFCLGVTRQVLDKVGYFDEIHFPRGYGEENDFCFRAADAGFGLVVATHTFVFHAKSKSYADADRIVLMREGSEALHKLHPPVRILRATEAMEHNPMLWKFRRSAAKLAAGLKVSTASK
jgi:GT2 family glycosyltransferase